jgi:hypothetical protein
VFVVVVVEIYVGYYVEGIDKNVDILGDIVLSILDFVVVCYGEIVNNDDGSVGE